MFTMKAYKNRKIASFDYFNSRCGRTIPEKFTTGPLKYPCISINFINLWLKSIDIYYVWSSQSYSNTMN